MKREDCFPGETHLRKAVRMMRTATWLLSVVFGLFGYWMFLRWSEPCPSAWPLLAAFSVFAFSSALAGRASRHYIKYRDAEDASSK